jgi:hypothetical protein
LFQGCGLPGHLVGDDEGLKHRSADVLALDSGLPLVVEVPILVPALLAAAGICAAYRTPGKD